MFEMYFQGLMIQAVVKTTSRGTCRVVVMPNVDPPMPRHHLILSMDVSAWDELGSKLATPPLQTGDSRCFRIGGLVTTNLAAGVAKANLPNVPTVSRFGGTIINQEILDLAPQNDILAILVLPDGRDLVEADYFAEKGTFGNNSDFCVPRTIRFSVDTGAPVSILLNNGQEYISLQPNASVYLTYSPSSFTAMDHFMSHSKFFANPSNLTVSLQPSSSWCDFGSNEPIRPKCSGGAHFSVECSNTQFP